MNSQRVIALVKKDLKKLTREPATLFMIILFPVVFTLIFGFSFGAIGGSQTATCQIGLVNMNADETQEKWTKSFVGNLSIFDLIEIQAYPDNSTAHSDLVQGKIQAVILVPANFGESCNSFQDAPTDPSQWVNTSLPLYLDSGSIFATQAIPPLVQQALLTAVFGERPISASLPVQISTPSITITSKTTMFDYFAPGMFAFASIFLAMTVAQSLTTDRENGLLRRINITPTSSTEFIISQTAANMITGLIQATLIFAMAYLVGYRPNVSPESFAFAFIIVLIFSLCNVGFGLITAVVAKSSGTATGLVFIFILPQLFLGTFVGSALSEAAQTAGKFVPSYYVTDALTSLFLRGASVSSPTILLDFIVVSATSMVTLLVGILLFRKYKKI